MASEKICAVDGCGKAAARRDLCNAHYLRLIRRGTTDRDPKWVRGRHCKGDRGQCPAAKKLANNLDYARKKELYRKRAKDWRAQNSERVKVLAQRDEVKVKARQRMREWSANNKERKREQDKKFYESNRALVNSYKAKRRAAVLSATPPWLTEQDWQAIREVYRLCDLMTVETGVEHEVDHIVPLQGKIVCGLHIATNLRVITAVANNRRPRIFSEP